MLLVDALDLLEPVIARRRELLHMAARKLGVQRFVAQNSVPPENVLEMQPNLLAAHGMVRAAIKAARGDLPRDVSLAMFDDQAAGPDSLRVSMREWLYGEWLRLARQDDFVSTQNYDRAAWISEPPNVQFAILLEPQSMLLARRGRALRLCPDWSANACQRRRRGDR